MASLRSFRKLGMSIRNARVNVIFNHLQPFLSREDTILDLGAGDCILGEKIVNEIGSEVTLVDVLDNNLTDLPLVLYDGRQLPFDDDSFDTVMVIYTLHHCDNIPAVIEEARRVCRKQLIVLEDNFHTRLGLFGLKMLDWWLAILEGMATPSYFKRPEEWALLFNQAGLRLENVIDLGFDDKIFKVRHIMFTLRPW